MERGATGSLWLIDLSAPSAPATQMANNLAYPTGLAQAGEGRLFVSEAWRHRILAFEAGARSAPQAVLSDLPRRVRRGTDPRPQETARNSHTDQCTVGAVRCAAREGQDRRRHRRKASKFTNTSAADARMAPPSSQEARLAAFRLHGKRRA
jgi:hypothetical protein